MSSSLPRTPRARDVGFDRDRLVGHVVNRLARRFAHGLYSRIRRYGVVPGQFEVLLCLWEEEGLTQTQLATRAVTEQPTMANTLKRMERDGLIRRVHDRRDRRRARIYPTKRANALKPTLLACAHAVQALSVRGLSKAAQDSFLTLCWRIVANLQRDRTAHHGKASFDAGPTVGHSKRWGAA